MSDHPRIRFDSLCMAAVRFELHALIGSQVQRMWQPDGDTLIFGLYGRGQQSQLLISIDPEFYRVHLLSQPPKRTPALNHTGRLFRAVLDSAVLARVDQVGFDRILKLVFESPEGPLTLVIELMGKHANACVIDKHREIRACLRTIGTTKSVRPIVVGKTYQPPPGDPRPSLWDVVSTGTLGGQEGLSPLLKRYLVAAEQERPLKLALAELRNQTERGGHSCWIYPDHGAYPLDLAPIGLHGERAESFSAALESTLGLQALSYTLQQGRQSLLSTLSRAKLAREATLHDLGQGLDAATNADATQRKGELILAYAYQIATGATMLNAYDYDGNPISIALNGELDAIANANHYFDKAKRAKANRHDIHDQFLRYEHEINEIEALMERVGEAADGLELEALRETAITRKWLSVQAAASPSAAQTPQFEGHRIRQLLGPQGFTILYGENASSNDYLTLRVGKPNDIWLHVRGGNSAHVIIQTHNQPQKVGQDVIRFAAEVAAKNSPSKHSSYVPVDYTLKKYVRKPKGAPVGTALYSQEKTIHVEPKL